MQRLVRTRNCHRCNEPHLVATSNQSLQRLVGRCNESLQRAQTSNESLQLVATTRCNESLQRLVGRCNGQLSKRGNEQRKRIHPNGSPFVPFLQRPFGPKSALPNCERCRNYFLRLGQQICVIMFPGQSQLDLACLYQIFIEVDPDHGQMRPQVMNGDDHPPSAFKYGVYSIGLGFRKFKWEWKMGFWQNGTALRELLVINASMGLGFSLFLRLYNWTLVPAKKI